MSREDKELEAKIVQMVKDGVNQNEIRHQLKIGSKKLQEIVRRNGLNTGKFSAAWSEEELEIVERLHRKEGLSPGKIFKTGLLPGRSKASIATRCYNTTSLLRKQERAAPAFRKSTKLLCASPSQTIPAPKQQGSWVIRYRPQRARHAEGSMSQRVGNALIVTGCVLLALAWIFAPVACVMGRY
ncbi:hypothetical protein HED54_14680 [Ochrobactrum anthropi ATCC 49188]|nr:hypothetical protein [Brucella anthropi ATCC 49188]NKC48969.1 hypothetical protein [Brucella anthropi ATCC 49188]